VPHLFEVVGPGPEPSCEESAPADGAQEDVACTQPDPSPAKVLKAWPMPAAESASEFPQELRALLQMELEMLVGSMETQMQLIEAAESAGGGSSGDARQCGDGSSVYTRQCGDIEHLAKVQCVLRTRAEEASLAWISGNEAREMLLLWLRGGSAVPSPNGTEKQPVEEVPDESQIQVQKLTHDLLKSQAQEAVAQEEAISRGNEVNLLKEVNTSMKLYVAKLRVAFLIVANKVWVQVSLLSRALEMWNSIVYNARTASKTVLLLRVFTFWKTARSLPRACKTSTLDNSQGSATIETENKARSSRKEGKHFNKAVKAAIPPEKARSENYKLFATKPNSTAKPSSITKPSSTLKKKCSFR